MALKRAQVCAYCKKGVAVDAMREHIRACESHPLNKLTKLMARLVKHGPNPYEHTTSRDYADAYNEASRFIHGMGIEL